MNVSISFAVSSFVLSLFIALGPYSSAAEWREGDRIPEISRFGLEGALPELKGKVLLVDFFASWCAPCKSSFPVMEQLQKKYGAQGFVVVAVSVDKKKQDLEGFLKKHPASFTVLRDESGKLVSDARIRTMPTSFLVDREGVIRTCHSGFNEETHSKYVAEIESLLK